MDHGNLRGVGIQKIEQISSSTDSLGANVIRVTLDDGSFYDYTVRNGDRGPAGSLWIGTSAPPDDSYSIWLNPSGMVSGYVGANQGAENAGRVLAVGEDGVVVPREETPYTLPEASPDAFGGIKADAAETADTQPVRKGTDGKLYTAPGGSGDAVLYTEQSLTEAQQEQARNNIGVRIPFVVTISKDSNGNITADKTFSAIQEAHDAGMTIYAAYESTMYSLVGYASDGIASFALNDRYNYIGFTCESSGVEDFWNYYEENLKSLEIFGASAGQVVKVKSVDENGVPTQWEAGDVSSGGADISLGISGATAGQMAKIKTVNESGAPTEWEAGDDTLPLLYHGKVSEAISGIEITEIGGNPMSLSEVKVRAVFKASTASWCGIELCTSAKNPNNKLITAEGGSEYTTAEKYYLVAAHGKISNGNFEINAVKPTQINPSLNLSHGTKNVASIKSIPNFVYSNPPELQEMNAENGRINTVRIFGNFSEVEVIIWGR